MVGFIDIISTEETYVSQRTLYAFKFNLLSDGACSIFFLSRFFKKII